MSSSGIQKLFGGIYSTFKCSFDDFVGEKVFSPSYFSAILAPSLCILKLMMMIQEEFQNTLGKMPHNEIERLTDVIDLER